MNLDPGMSDFVVTLRRNRLSGLSCCCCCEQPAAGGAHRSSVCGDQATLATEIAEGAGKCMPAIAKTRENTGRPSCGPERSWPPDRVTSRMTMAMPPVNVNDLISRLVVNAPKQVPPNPTELRLRPAQRKRQAFSGQPMVEPLVRPRSALISLTFSCSQ